MGAGAGAPVGTSEADLLHSYPSLRAEDLAHAWAYVRSHREDIEREIVENEAAYVVARLLADENVPLAVAEHRRAWARFGAPRS
jgi:hypothetical protein